VQATVLELVQALAADYGTAVIFVSHDLGVIRTIAHRALVMQNGVIREHGATRQIFEHPADDYTRELIRSTVAFAPAAADASADHPVTLTPRRD
jgi:ABC-type microcin C transport system duplicated ATPase subunit YejF